MEQSHIKETALITGGSSGMGLEYARQLAGRGYSLALVSNRAEDLAKAKSELEADYSATVYTLEADLAQNGAAEKVLQWCENNSLQIEILINNAGMFFAKYLSADELPRIRAIMGLHMNFITESCVLFSEQMKPRGRGHILIVSSMTAQIPAPGITMYSSTKAYLKIFGKSLSHELRPYGVKVTTVCPGAVDTGLYPLSPRMRKIGRSLGFIVSPERFVKRALKAMFRGRRVKGPGIMNAWVAPLVSILPNRLIDNIGMRWFNKE